uniref:Uncharacterized protein n=1 Tax=Rhizophora mucronata TaxID=61149 RepID=A0A2P2NL39_RHIMU
MFIFWSGRVILALHLDKIVNSFVNSLKDNYKFYTTNHQYIT